MVVSDQLHALAALPRGKIYRYPMNRRLGEFESQFGCCGEEKKISPARVGNRTPVVQLVD
jgi:hypothetical protein